MKNQKPSMAARFMVFSGPAIAFLFTCYAIGAGSGTSLLFAVWFWAAAWSFLAALAGALWRGFRRRDWSAFRRYELPDGREERHEWSGKTGRYAYLREFED